MNCMIAEMSALLSLMRSAVFFALKVGNHSFCCLYCVDAFQSVAHLSLVIDLRVFPISLDERCVCIATVSSLVPSFASVSAASFPLWPAWAFIHDRTTLFVSCI